MCGIVGPLKDCCVLSNPALYHAKRPWHFMPKVDYSETSVSVVSDRGTMLHPLVILVVDE